MEYSINWLFSLCQNIFFCYQIVLNDSPLATTLIFLLLLYDFLLNFIYIFPKNRMWKILCQFKFSLIWYFFVYFSSFSLFVCLFKLFPKNVISKFQKIISFFFCILNFCTNRYFHTIFNSLNLKKNFWFHPYNNLI